MNKLEKLERGTDILLFYKKHKWDYVKRYSKRTISGFYSWYILLQKALKKSGYRVHENRYDLAQANPTYPVGIVGTPILIPEWNLPNPAILGPAMYDHPKINPSLMKDHRFIYYILTCQWLKDVFEPYYGSSCILWRAGIEPDIWIDTANHPKYLDVLIYDKIRWNREKIVPLMMESIKNYLQRKGLSYYVLKYGNITHQTYKNLLSNSRSMVFLCEHETQGMAYQEAMACNLPILAWDYEWWIDPIWVALSREPVPATSVPYFSNKCGMKFKMIEEFPEKFEIFWKNLGSYRPREFVKKELSFRKSSEIYTDYYFSLY